MNNIFIISGIIALVYFIIKFIEMRFIEKESKPLKLLIRDALLVYFSVVMGYFILEQIKPVIGEGNHMHGGNTPAFTDNPEF